MSRIIHRGKTAFKFRVNEKYRILTYESEADVANLEKKLSACRELGIPEIVLEKIASERFSDEAISKYWKKRTDKPESKNESDLSLGEVLYDNYIPLDFEKKKSKNTQKIEKPMLKCFYDFCYDYLEVDYMGDIETIHIDQFVAHLNERGLKPQSVNRYMNPVRKFFRWSYRRRLISYNPCDVVEPQSETKAKKAVWSNDQLSKLAELSESNPNRYRWINDIAKFMCLCGLRPGQVADLNFEDIDLDGRLIQTGTSKGGSLRAYKVPINDDLFQFLTGHFEQARLSFRMWPQKRVFLNSEGGDLTYNAIRCALDRLKEQYDWADGMTSYGGRRYFATALEKAGVSLNRISKLLGHARSYTTQGYTDVDEMMLAQAANSVKWQVAL